MRVCGVELKGGEAIVCLLHLEKGAYHIPESRQRSFAVTHSQSTDAMREFYFAFSKLLEDYHVDQVVIIERDQKGKNAGSATSFKLEAAIQLIDLPVVVMHSSDIKLMIQRNPIPVEFDSLGLKKFQRPAFNVAFAYQNVIQYGLPEEQA